MDRISTASAYAGAINNLMQRQVALSNTQVQMTSGKRVLHASDDPTAAARAERARTLEGRADAGKRAADASRNAMQLTESALGDAGEILQQIREQVVAAGNASYTDAERGSVAKNIRALRDQLLSVANRPDGSGGFVFAGQGSGTQPFSDAPGGVQYNGVSGQVQVASDEPLPLTLDGKGIWLEGNTGNGVFETVNTSNSKTAWIDAGHVADPSLAAAHATDSYAIQFSGAGAGSTYDIVRTDSAGASTTLVSGAAFTTGQQITVDGMSFAVTGQPTAGDTFGLQHSTPTLSVFSSIDKIVNALTPTAPGQPAPSASQVTQTIQTGLRDIDQSSAKLQSARSFAGQVLNQIDGVQGRLDATKLWGETTRSDAEDLDMVQALSTFQSQQTGYQAALQSYATVQKMSLLQYINV